MPDNPAPNHIRMQHLLERLEAAPDDPLGALDQWFPNLLTILEAMLDRIDEVGDRCDAR